MSTTQATTNRGFFFNIRNLPINRKLLRLVMVPLTLITVGFMALTINGINRFESETSRETLAQDVQIITHQFEELQENLLLKNAQMGTNQAILKAIELGNRNEISNYLISNMLSDSSLSFQQVVGSNGQILAAQNQPNLDLIGNSPELKQLSNLSLLGIESSELVPSSQGWLMTTARPIKNQQGQILGTMISGTLMDDNFLWHLNSDRSNPMLMLFDPQGHFIASSSHEAGEVIGIMPANHEAISLALNGEITFDNISLQGQIWRVAYAPLVIEGKPQAVMHVMYSTASTAALRSQLVSLTLIIFAALGGLATLVAYVFGRIFISQPLSSLSITAEKFIGGNWEVTAPGAAYSDEIGLLAKVLNAMMEELRTLIGSLERRVADRTKALATSAEISRRLSTLLDQRQLVKEVVEQVQSAFNYYHTHIYLVDDSTGDLVMAGGTGEAGASMLARGHKIKRGHGLVGRAAEANMPVLVPDTSKDSNWLPNLLLMDTKSEVAVPISIGDRVLGVLDVQHNITDGLNQEDSILLVSIANQVAIALQNARTFEQSKAQAEIETQVNLIGQKIQRAASVEDVLQTAVREVGLALGASRVSASLGSPEKVRQPGTPGGNNGAGQH